MDPTTTPSKDVSLPNTMPPEAQSQAGVLYPRTTALNHKLRQVMREYRQLDLRSSLLDALEKENWDVDRIVIVGLGRNLWQLAQVLDISRFLSQGQGGRRIDLFIQDPVYESKADEFPVMLQHLRMEVLRTNGASVQPASECITSTTFVYAPFIPYTLVPELLRAPIPAAWFGSPIDAGLAELDALGPGRAHCFWHLPAAEREHSAMLFREAVDAFGRKDLDGLRYQVIGFPTVALARQHVKKHGASVAGSAIHFMGLALHRRRENVACPREWYFGRTPEYQRNLALMKADPKDEAKIWQLYYQGRLNSPL
jgi:hypothetical protein